MELLYIFGGDFSAGWYRAASAGRVLSGRGQEIPLRFCRPHFWNLEIKRIKMVYNMSLFILLEFFGLYNLGCVILPFKNFRRATHFRSHVILWFCDRSFSSVKVLTVSSLNLITMWSCDHAFWNFRRSTLFRSHVILWFCDHSFSSVKVLTVSSLTLITLWSCDLVIMPLKNFRRATLYRSHVILQFFDHSF